ncbi:transposase [Acidobacteria bacterium AB60]|nr:transposase [Acidobacteria bacterium AB60]
MPTGLYRLHHSSQAHFLTFSCFHRKPLLDRLGMYDPFLEALEQVRRRLRFRVFAYVVMPEHVHLLVNEPEVATVAAMMQLLKTKVALRARTKIAQGEERMPFWQDRYFDHNVRNHAGFVTQLRYIHRNPVKRGLCSAPQDYPWSSFRAWGTGAIGIVEVECDWTARRREQDQAKLMSH